MRFKQVGLSALGVLWSLFVAIRSIQTHPWFFPEFTLWPSSILLFTPFIIGLGFCILAMIGGHGWLTIAGCKPNSLCVLIASWPMGLLLIALIGGILGVTSGFGPGFLLMLTVLLAAPSLYSLPLISWQTHRRTITNILQNYFVVAIAIGIALIAYLNLLGISAPTISYDDQVYQLTIPKLYLEAGRLVDLPDLSPSYRPQNLHLFYTLIGLLGNESSMRTVNWFTGLLTTLLLILVMGIRFGPFAGAIAGITFYANPEIVVLSRTAQTDLLTTYLFLAGIFVLFDSFHNHEKDRLICMAVITSYVAGVKTSGLGISLFFALSTAISLIFFNVDKDNQRRKTSCFFWFCLAFILLGSPWYIRNWYLTGNPIFPHLGYLWNSESLMSYVPAFKEVFKQYLPFSYDHEILLNSFGMGRDFVNMLLLPWNVTMHCHIHDKFHPLCFFDGEIGFMPLALLPHIIWAAMVSGKRSGFSLLAMITLGTFVAWAWGSHQIRFLIPAFSLTACLIGWWFSSFEKMKFLGWMMAVLTMISTISFAVVRTEKLADFLTGKKDKTTFLKSNLPFYNAYDFMNSLSREGKIFAIGEERVFYLQRPFHWAPFLPEELISAFSVARKSEEIAVFLKKIGITILYLPYHKMTDMLQLFDDEKYRRNIHDFFRNNARKVFTDESGEVFVLD